MYPSRLALLAPQDDGSEATASSRGVTLRLGPGFDLALGFGLGKAVTLPQAANEFGAAAGDARNILVGELDPIVAQFPLELRPIDLNLIPVHRLSPVQGRTTPHSASFMNPVMTAARCDFNSARSRSFGDEFCSGSGGFALSIHYPRSNGSRRAFLALR